MTRFGFAAIRHRSTRASAAASLLASLLSSSAYAEDPTRVADDLFNAASAAYQRGDYSAAARAFDEAQRQAPRAETSYNSAIAWEAAGDPRRAANALYIALDTGPLPERLQSDAQARLTRLSAGFGRLRLSGPPTAEVEIDGLLREKLPTATYAEPGSYRIAISYENGEHEARTVTLAQGATLELAFSPKTPSPRAATAQAAYTLRPPSTHWQVVTGIAALGTAGIAAGTGLALGVRGLAARDRFNDSGHTDAHERDQAVSLRTYADLAFGGALALSAVGVLLLVEVPKKNSDSAFLIVGPSVLGVGRRF